MLLYVSLFRELPEFECIILLYLILVYLIMRIIYSVNACSGPRDSHCDDALLYHLMWWLLCACNTYSGHITHARDIWFIPYFNSGFQEALLIWIWARTAVQMVGKVSSIFELHSTGINIQLGTYRPTYSAFQHKYHCVIYVHIFNLNWCLSLPSNLSI